MSKKFVKESHMIKKIQSKLKTLLKETIKKIKKVEVFYSKPNYKN